MLVDFSISPLGKGESLSPYVAQVYRLIEESGLPHEYHAMGTNIEGDWDAVMGLIKSCRDFLLQNVNRVSISIRIDDRKGVTDGLTRKTESAKDKMGS
ncbi:MAG: MTH1187 family thiamine-binding protein [Candidatus Bipolaricaulota bacterium]|nr:MTH1187 family thiamine-binding protein [Candidatus Bipolaricaulota bacterium]